MQAWKRLNPDSKVIVIDETNIDHYAPDYKPYIARLKRQRSFTSKSNLLRLLLLARHGGIWADASVFPMLPVNLFLPCLVNETGFFTYRFFTRMLSSDTRGDRETVSWFLVAPEPGHFLVQEWLNRYLDIFMHSDKYTFFAIHQALCDIFDENPAIRECICQMPQITERIPHSLLENQLKGTVARNEALAISNHSLQSRSIAPHRHRFHYSFVYKRPLHIDILTRLSASLAADFAAQRPVSPLECDEPTDFPVRQMIEPLIGSSRDALVQAFLHGVSFFDSQRPEMVVKV